MKIVQTPTAEMFQAGQTAMQNVLTTNPDVKLVLAYASDGGSGASQAIMDELAKGAGSVIKDLTKVAVFGVGCSAPRPTRSGSQHRRWFPQGRRLLWRRRPARQTAGIASQDPERRGYPKDHLGRAGPCHAPLTARS